MREGRRRRADRAEAEPVDGRRRPCVRAEPRGREVAERAVAPRATHRVAAVDAPLVAAPEPERARVGVVLARVAADEVRERRAYRVVPPSFPV